MRVIKMHGRSITALPIRQACTRQMAPMLKYRKTSLLSLVVIGLFVYYTGTIIHFSREFILRNNFNLATQLSYIDTSQQRIPKIIHQIFFNFSVKSVEFMKRYHSYQQSWIKLNPDHKYILWNASMLDKLVDERYPEFKPIYHKPHYKWINRADMARYLVVHHMGGVYADMDIKCKQSLNTLYKESGYKGLLLNFTYNPVGIATDFFAASKNHNFLSHVLDGLAAADVPYLIPYVATMFRTGPVFLLGRYLNYPFSGEIYWISPETSLKLADRTSFGQSWHGLDGKVIDLLWTRIGPKKICLFIVLVACVYRWLKRPSRPRHNRAHVDLRKVI